MKNKEIINELKQYREVLLYLRKINQSTSKKEKSKVIVLKKKFGNKYISLVE